MKNTDLHLHSIHSDSFLEPKEKLQILKKAKKIAKKYNLIETGGSDFHSLKEKLTLIGNYNISYEVVKKLKKLL